MAILTGGQGDLARGIAEALSREGWEVHAPGREELDVTDAASVKAYFARFSAVDLMVHNAGFCRDASMLKMDEADFDAVLEVHLRGAFLCTQAVLKLMSKAKAGHIIHIGSFSALSGPIGQANYAAAKAGLIGLTQSTAKEYGSRNVRCNCVLPGFIPTRMTQALLDEPAQQERILQAHALGRLNTVEDAARFIAFLHSMEHVSGQVFQLDSRIRRWT